MALSMVWVPRWPNPLIFLGFMVGLAMIWSLPLLFIWEARNPARSQFESLTTISSRIQALPTPLSSHPQPPPLDLSQPGTHWSKPPPLPLSVRPKSPPALHPPCPSTQTFSSRNCSFSLVSCPSVSTAWIYTATRIPTKPVPINPRTSTLWYLLCQCRTIGWTSRKWKALASNQNSFLWFRQSSSQTPSSKAAPTPS